MSYTMYTPLNVWLDPASVTDVVAYIQTYLSENTIYSETEIETLIHDYLIAHPELIGGVQSVNGKTGTVVLSASDINTENNVTIESVLASLSSQISTIAANVATNTTNITNLTGRVSTAETDISNLKSNLTKINHAFIVVDDDTTFSAVNTLAEATNKECILVLRKNVSVSNGDTFSYKISKVIGLGGKFASETANTIINFYRETAFECGQFQMFDATVIPKSTHSLRGEAIPQWWGVAGSPSTDVNDAIGNMMASSFKTIRFLPGTYVCHPTNKVSGRTLIFDNGAVIDGIVHIAYGSNVGVTDKFWCKNTTVKGKVVSTLRVGGAMIDGLVMPDGIQILDKNASYINQSIGGEPCGVHFHFGCKNISIGDIKVAATYPRTNGSIAFALAIDTESGESAPSNIYIDNVQCGENTSNYYDIMLNGVNNIYINSIGCAGGEHAASIYINGCQNINLSNVNMNKSGNSKYGILVQNSNRVVTNTVRIISSENTGVWGYCCNGSNNVMIDNLITARLGQAIRLLTSNYVFITCHTSDNDTTPLAEVSSIYKALHRFVVS